MDVDKLEVLPLFAALPPAELAELAAHFEETAVEAGTVLAKEGDFSYRFFGILGGTAAVTRDRRHLANLASGDFFGEVGAKDDNRRNATVVATSDMTLATMMSWSFRDMLEHHPVVGASIEEAIAKRLADG